MKISAIYKIQSIVKPERVYIGSAVNIEKRWREHLSFLRKGNHHSPKLQYHFDKYGENDLQFSILLECSKQDLLTREQDYLDALNPYFNICKIADRPLGVKRSEETNEKHRILMLGNKNREGKYHSEETKQQMRETALLNGSKPPSTKGMKWSDKTQNRHSEQMIGNQNGFKKGYTPYNKAINI